jgi:hypothetical protein
MVDSKTKALVSQVRGIRALHTASRRRRNARYASEVGRADAAGRGRYCAQGSETRLAVDTMVAMYRLGVAPALLFGLGWRVPRI